MNQNGSVLHLQKVAGISGSEAHLLSLLPRLKQRGWDIRFLMLHEHEPGAWAFARELTGRGIPLDSIPLAADVDPFAFLRLAGYLVRRRPTILHTHLVHADVYGQLAGALTGVPLRVSTKHGFNEFRENPGFALGDRAIATFAHTHIAISRGLARYLEEVEGFDGSSFEIVHYGIEPNGSPRPYAGAAPVLLCVGRLIPIKGHIVLLRAFAAARRRIPDLQLHIAGRGPLEPALRALALELELEDSVRFLGYVPVDELRALYAAARVFVYPSLWEGFGLPPLEAMACGCPVITSRVSALPEVAGGAALLVDPTSVDEIVDGIATLWCDDSLRRANVQRGLARAHEFTWKRAAQETAAVYDAALS